MTSRPDPQAGLFDRTIEDPELEEALEVIQEHQDAGRAWNRAKRVRKARLAEHELHDMERLRVGRFVVTGRLLEGGGFEMPEWSTVSVGSTTEL